MIPVYRYYSKLSTSRDPGTPGSYKQNALPCSIPVLIDRGYWQSIPLNVIVQMAFCFKCGNRDPIRLLNNVSNPIRNYYYYSESDSDWIQICTSLPQT